MDWDKLVRALTAAQDAARAAGDSSYGAVYEVDRAFTNLIETIEINYIF